MDKDPIILLRKNGFISLTNIENLDHATRKESNVMYVVIDVGLDTPEYLIIPRERFIRKFKYAEFIFDYHIAVYCDGLVNDSDKRSCHFICKNVIEFYRTVHSLCKLEAANRFLHDDFYTVSVEGKFTNANLLIDIKGKPKSIDIESTSESSNKHDSSYVLDIINFMVYDDASVYMIPDSSDTPRVSIDLENYVWYPKQFKSDMMSVYQEFFRCNTFITKKDLNTLNNIVFRNGFYATSFEYIMIPRNHLPEGEEIDSRNIYTYDGEYIELLRECNMNAQPYSLYSLLEFLVNVRYLYDSARLEADVAYGEMDVKILLSVQYHFRKEDGPNYSSIISFNYDINENMIMKGMDIYDDFIKKVKKNYKKFVRGECVEEEYW
jgi:hypothetical protein